MAMHEPTTTACISTRAALKLKLLVERKVDVLDLDSIGFIEQLVESYILFDKIYLAERTKVYPEGIRNILNELDDLPTGQGHVFLEPGDEYKPNNNLLYFSNETVDHRALDLETYGEIHHYLDFANEREEMDNSNAVRFFEYSAISNLSAHTKSFAYFSPSLESIQKHTTVCTGKNGKELIVRLFNEFQSRVRAENLKDIDECRKFLGVAEINESLSEPMQLHLDMPPLLQILISKVNGNENILAALKAMRRDYRELRKIRKICFSEEQSVETQSQRREWRHAWIESWSKLVENDFSIPSNPHKIIRSDLITSVLNFPSLIKLTIDTFDAYIKHRREFSRYAVFGKLKSDIAKIKYSSLDINRAFGVTQVNFKDSSPWWCMGRYA